MLAAITLPALIPPARLGLDRQHPCPHCSARRPPRWRGSAPGATPGAVRRNGRLVARVLGARRRLSLVPVEVDLRGQQRGVVEDDVGRLLGQHHHGCVDVAVGDVGHDRRVDHAQALGTAHAHRERVDDRHRAGLDGGGATRVQRRLRVVADAVEDLCVGPQSGRGRASPSKARSAGWSRIFRVTRMASTDSRRSGRSTGS